MAGIELPDLQSAAIAGEMGAQIAVERARIEAMTLHDRDGVGVSRRVRGWHVGRERRVRARSSRQTLRATERNAIRAGRHGVQPLIASACVVINSWEDFRWTS